MDNYSESSESNIRNLIESPPITTQDDEYISDDFVMPPQIDFDFLHDQCHLGENEEHEDNLVKKKSGPRRNAIFLEPPHGALPHPNIDMEFDQAIMNEFMLNYARQEGSTFIHKKYCQGFTIRWRCIHNGMYNNHHGLPWQVTDKKLCKEKTESGSILCQCD